MDEVVKTKWVAALRSGEYKQDQGHLQTKFGFCCFGVLCDLHSKETGIQWERLSYGGSAYGGLRGFPPSFVTEWADITDSLRVEIDGEIKTLDGHNDKGRTFLEIAQAIEEQL